MISLLGSRSDGYEVRPKLRVTAANCTKFSCITPFTGKRLMLFRIWFHRLQPWREYRRLCLLGRVVIKKWKGNPKCASRSADVAHRFVNPGRFDCKIYFWQVWKMLMRPKCETPLIWPDSDPRTNSAHTFGPRVHCRWRYKLLLVRTC